MPKFFQSEIAAYNGDKVGFRNVKFKKNDFQSSAGAEAGSILEFIPVHYPEPPVIQFIAYVTSFTERYDVKQSAEQPFGRTNPFYIWQGNDRSISLSFDMPSSGISKGLDNLNNLSWLLASLYPTFKDTTTATSIAASPLFRVRYANLICSSTKSGQGLLCAIGNINVSHDMEAGFLSANPKNMGSAFANNAAKAIVAAGVQDHVAEGKKFLIPKLIKLTLDLKVVHDHALGWDYHTGEFRGGRSAPSFPHDFGLFREGSPGSPAAGAATTTPAASTGPPGSPSHTQGMSNEVNKTFNENPASTGDPTGVNVEGEG